MEKIYGKLALFAVAIATIFYLAGPTITGPTNAAQQTACYGEQGGVKQVAESGCEYEFQSGATLDVQEGVEETHANDVTFSGTITVTGSIVEDSVTTSGPVRFGAATSVVSGTTIAHGIGTTPTMVLLTPQYNGVFTQGMYVLSTDATSITVGLESGPITTVTMVNWLAGK